MEVNTVWCLAYPYHIKIHNSNIYVKNKLHGLVMGSEFKPATTMVSLLGDCEQSPYSAAKSNPIVSLNNFKSPPVGQQPNTSLATTTIVGQKKQTLLHIPLHCVLLLSQVAPIHWLSPILPPGKYQTSSMGSTTYSPGSSVFSSPNHAPAEQHSTNWLDSPALAATLPCHCTQYSQQTQPISTVHLQFAFQIYCNHRNLANWSYHWQRHSSSRVYSI